METHIIDKAYAENIVYYNNKAIGVVVGTEFQQRAQGTRIFVRVPQAIVLSPNELRTAEGMGAKTIAIFDTETGTIYRTELGEVWFSGLSLMSGNEEKVALDMHKWHATLPPAGVDIDTYAGL